MTCPICGRFHEGDSETGYSADEICPYHTVEEVDEYMQFEEDLEDGEDTKDGE